MKHFQNKIGFDKDRQYKYVSDDLYKNGIFTDDENEIAVNVNKKLYKNLNLFMYKIVHC